MERGPGRGRGKGVRHAMKTSMEISEARERLEAMAEDHGETWDLSPNDQFAIRIVLDLLREIEDAKNGQISHMQEMNRLLSADLSSTSRRAVKAEDALRQILEEVEEALRTGGPAALHQIEAWAYEIVGGVK